MSDQSKELNAMDIKPNILPYINISYQTDHTFPQSFSHDRTTHPIAVAFWHKNWCHLRCTPKEVALLFQDTTSLLTPNHGTPPNLTHSMRYDYLPLVIPQIVWQTYNTIGQDIFLQEIASNITATPHNLKTSSQGWIRTSTHPTAVSKRTHRGPKGPSDRQTLRLTNDITVPNGIKFEIPSTSDSPENAIRSLGVVFYEENYSERL